jgi:tetratricopeptide (TPR) repeat protein
MKAISRIALGISLALAGGLALAPATAKKAESKAAALSPDVQNNLAAAQTAMDKKDWATAQAKVSAAEAVAKTDGDRFNIGVIKFNIGRNTNNEQLQGQGADMAIASNAASDEQLKQLLNVQGVIAYNAKDYPKAATAFARLYQLDPNTEGNLDNLIQAQILSGQAAAAQNTVNQAIASKKAAGQPVPEAWLKRSLGMAVNSKGAVPVAALTELVASYPTVDNWRDALIIYRDANKADPVILLDLMRLARAVHAMKGESDYYYYASTALNRGLPGEAKAVIDEGIQTHAVDATRPVIRDIQTTASSKIAADRASLPKFEATKPASTADAYLGYGDYAKAAALYRTALQKGGGDTTAINLNLGIALALSGDKAGAKQALDLVTGPRATVAKFWTIYLGQRA